MATVEGDVRKHACGKIGETSARCVGCELVEAGGAVENLRAHVRTLDARLAEVEKERDALRLSLIDVAKVRDGAQQLAANVVTAQCDLLAKLAAAEAQAKRYEKALRKIKGMGRVCENFELCEHASCSDSCDAVLTAIAALDAAAPPEPMQQDRLCKDHGFGVAADEDGCCATCGRTCAIVEIVVPFPTPEEGEEPTRGES